jgi:flagellar basal-body rod protein FlgB
MIESTHTSLFAQMQARMDWLDRRQGVLAQNIANADTPGYRPQDLKAFDDNTLSGGGQFALAVRQTAAGHLDTPQPAGHTDAVTTRKTFEIAPAGNAVDLEEQMAKVADTATAHKTTTELYRKYLGLIKTVLNAKG